MLVGVYNGIKLLQSVWQFLRDSSLHLPYEPAILLIVVFSRKMSAYASPQKTSVRIFVAVLYIIHPSLVKGIFKVHAFLCMLII